MRIANRRIAVGRQNRFAQGHIAIHSHSVGSAVDDVFTGGIHRSRCGRGVARRGGIIRRDGHIGVGSQSESGSGPRPGPGRSALRARPQVLVGAHVDRTVAVDVSIES